MKKSLEEDFWRRYSRGSSPERYSRGSNLEEGVLEKKWTHEAYLGLNWIFLEILGLQISPLLSPYHVESRNQVEVSFFDPESNSML